METPPTSTPAARTWRARSLVLGPVIGVVVGLVTWTVTIVDRPAPPTGAEPSIASTAAITAAPTARERDRCARDRFEPGCLAPPCAAPAACVVVVPGLAPAPSGASAARRAWLDRPARADATASTSWWVPVLVG